MKILLYGDHHLGESGIGRELRFLIPSLKKEHEVRQVALNFFTPGKELVPTYSAMGKSNTFWAPEILESAIEEFRPDIVFSNRDTFLLAMIAPVILKSRAWKMKWVHWNTIDGIPLSKEVTQGALLVHKNIVQSKFARDALRHAQLKHFSKTSDVEIIYPPVDIEAFKEVDDRASLKKKYRLEGRFVVLCVARNHFRKNIPCLMEAVALLKERHPDILLLLHCLPSIKPDGRPGGYFLQEIAEELNLTKHIGSIGSNAPLPDSVMNELYNVADVHCLPSMGEGFGLPIIEAMLAGTPNIATDCSSLTELLEDGRGLLVRPAAQVRISGNVRHAVLSSEDLARGISTLYKSKETREQIVRNARSFAANFNAKKVSERLLEIFSQLLSSDASRLSDS